MNNNIAPKDFNILEADGSNYLTWAMDVKIKLSSKGYINTINEPNATDPAIPDTTKYAVLHFLRHHIHSDLKNEYLMEEDPIALWVSLKDRYDHQKAIMLPEARREWSLIRLMDFKSIGEYNSAIHKICSKLRFCDQPVSDEDLIEKTLSTFLPANRLLQQQYRNEKYTKYSALIHDLAQAEKQDKLLTKNHQMRPPGTAPLPEVHFNVQNNKKFGGKKHKKNFKGKWANKRQRSKGSNKGKGNPKHHNNDNSQVCQQCGYTNHSTEKCRTPKHLVELYMKYSGKGKQVQEDKIEAYFNCQEPEVGCSKDVPIEHEKDEIRHSWT